MKAEPVTPLPVLTLVMAGAGGIGWVIVSEKFWVPLPVAFVAVRPKVYTPAETEVETVPEIRPVALLMLRPETRPLAP